MPDVLTLDRLWTGCKHWRWRREHGQRGLLGRCCRLLQPGKRRSSSRGGWKVKRRFRGPRGRLWRIRQPRERGELDHRRRQGQQGSRTGRDCGRWRRQPWKGARSVCWRRGLQRGPGPLLVRLGRRRGFLHGEVQHSAGRDWQCCRYRRGRRRNSAPEPFAGEDPPACVFPGSSQEH